MTLKSLISRLERLEARQGAGPGLFIVTRQKDGTLRDISTGEIYQRDHNFGEPCLLVICNLPDDFQEADPV